jgi:hypothetical protein
MSISRFTSSLLAGSQENTLALAALNFDFSLYKVEAPAEYQALGTLLSEERRHIGESGSHHITARKLGALFRSRLPSVPLLTKAYGERVSSIAKKVKAADKVKNVAMQTIFSRKMGFDGTSIWAAATSGPEAICIQLLGCILSRFWSAPEAISIWVEIIEERKKELNRQEGDFDFPEIAAAQAIVTREQLAEWDASTRSWLRTADEQMAKRQTQLRLVVNSLHVAVNNSKDTYNSVLEAWIKSMELVNNLIAGAPQRIHEGAVLVGLSSWHLYPDMIVYSQKCTDIAQGDEIFPPGSLLTIGLQPSPQADKGVYWSLPLSKLRFYGDPVVVTKSLDSRNARVSFDQLMMVVIGCLARQWPKKDDIYETVCNYYILVCKKSENLLGPDTGHRSWLRWLSIAGKRYLDAEDETRETYKRLIDFGYRRCVQFLDTKDGPVTWDDQMFQLTSPKVFTSCMTDLQARIEYLRSLVSDLKSEEAVGEWLIIYKEPGAREYAYTTALRVRHPFDAKRDRQTRRHYRWGSKPSSSQDVSNSYDIVEPLHGWGLYSLDKNTLWTGDKSERTTLMKIGQCDTSRDPIWRIFKPRRLDQKRQGLDKKGKTVSGGGWFVDFGLVFGDQKVAGLYRKLPSNIHSIRDRVSPRRIDFDQILAAWENEKLSLAGAKTTNSVRVLQGLAVAGDLYRPLEAATVSMDITNSSLGLTSWYKDLMATAERMPYHCCDHLSITSAIAFSCLAFMETGDQDIEPKMLDSVMAMSVDDSIFAVEALVSDPHHASEPGKVVKALGNIGKPGLSLLIPPLDPKVRRPKTDEWNVITHGLWDGTGQDYFGSTSLHLLMTEYRVPYASEHRGSRDIQAYFQEAVISIYDGMTWVGDVDIVEALTKESGVYRVPGPQSTTHQVLEEAVGRENGQCKVRKKSKKSKHQDEDQTNLKSNIRCIDNWYELIDKPSGPAVVRSHGNWIGRLAAASLCAQLGYRTSILADGDCDRGCFSNIGFVSEYIIGDDDNVVLIM